jgi:hypothetical protein
VEERAQVGRDPAHPLNMRAHPMRARKVLKTGS